MRRVPSRSMPCWLLGATAVAAMAAGVLAPAVAYAAEPSDAAPASPDEGSGDPYLGPATPGEVVCTLSDNTLDKISGLAVVGGAIYVVEDENLTVTTLHTINESNCAATKKTFGTREQADPLSPRDLAIGPNNTLWIADTGVEGDGTGRATWAVTMVDPAVANKATINRMTFPGGAAPTVSATALLIEGTAGAEVPILITGNGAVYKPTSALVPNSRNNLPEVAQVATFTPQDTGTSSGLGAIGNTMVTGAAQYFNADGSRKVVIRTGSDAYEYDVPAGSSIVDVLQDATVKPAITPLPGEPNGTAITYNGDGTKFLTVSGKAGSALLRYTPHVPVLETGGTETTSNEPSQPSLLDRIGLRRLKQIVAAVGVVGLVLAIAGIVGIRRARRRREEEDEYDDYDDDYDDPRGRGRGRGGRGRGGYDEGYDQGYGGYGQGPGYGGQPPAYGGDPYAADQQYGAAPGYDAYGQQPQYGGDQYGAQYGADQYGAQYGADQYGGDQYGGQQYAAGAPAYGGDQYGGGYGGYDEYDPTDPRNR